MAMWHRRLAVDKSALTPGTKVAKAQGGASGYDDKLRPPKFRTGLLRPRYWLCLWQDPSHNRLHTHGRQTVTKFYSICMAGKYKLHIGLRQQGLPLPGSVQLGLC